MKIKNKEQRTKNKGMKIKSNEKEQGTRIWKLKNNEKRTNNNGMKIKNKKKIQQKLPYTESKSSPRSIYQVTRIISATNLHLF